MSLNDSFLDLSKPLVWQFFRPHPISKTTYLNHVFHPQHSHKGSVRLFHNGVLEWFSRAPVWVVPLVWLPVAFFVSQQSHLSLASWTMYFAIGFFCATFVEYCLHRFVLHADDLLPDYPVVLLVHFLGHGLHHFVPHDPYRLVLPPLFLFLIMVVVWFLLSFIVPNWDCQCSIVPGMLVEYVLYDVTHFVLHSKQQFLFLLPSFFHSLLQMRQDSHMYHHFNNKNLRFGVSSPFWDHVFGSSQKKS